MPPATENFNGLLHFSSEEHLPDCVAYNHRHRTPLDRFFFKCGKPSVVKKVGRRPHQIKILNNSTTWPVTIGSWFHNMFLPRVVHSVFLLAVFKDYEIHKASPSHWRLIVCPLSLRDISIRFRKRQLSFSSWMALIVIFWRHWRMIQEIKKWYKLSGL